MPVLEEIMSVYTFHHSRGKTPIKSAVTVLLILSSFAGAISCGCPDRYTPENMPEKSNILGIEIIMPAGKLMVNTSVTVMAVILSGSGEKSRLYYPDVRWSSSDPNILDIDRDGIVTVKRPGTCGITAAFGEYSASEDLTAESGSDFSMIFISEVFYDAAGSDTGREFIEIYNGGDYECDISGLRLIDGAPGSTAFIFPPDCVMPSRGFMTVAQSAEGFSQLFGTAPDYSGFSFALNNSGETVLLVRPDGSVNDRVFIEGGCVEKPVDDSWGSATLPSAGEGQSVYRMSFNGAGRFDTWTAGVPSPNRAK
jgi:hypothetical protein